ncbi:MAG: tRNA (adenosine(37)-N6)-threonylcarbamoyltransferase complex transferase subunit TsaD [Candidatus Aenigmarchaeota archaeon]|nr:tRNA (adenosine(37)-N6)-threonylcarbamoyltransferase complex transferase subunit TsaD [Candidatus Aenigmarchaeota archaeon]
MLVLGIESTAHTFGIGVADENGNLRCEATRSQKDMCILVDEKSVYKPKDGIVPMEAAEFHRENSAKVLQKIEDKIDLNEVDLIGVSAGPGLPPCLYYGLEFAEDLAKRLKKPLVGINHCRAHVEIGRILTKAKDPVVLYVSGGNTQIIYENNGYRVLGETQDIGIGNAIDKLGRVAGLSFPAGPKIEKLARNGKFVLLPYSVKGMDLNFSGVLSEAVRRLKNESNKVEDIFYSFQEVCFAMLAEVTERAMAATEKNELLLVGGVAQNQRLQEMLGVMCEERNAKLKSVPKEFAGDNGAMIAITALVDYKNKNIETQKEVKINPNWRIDSI